MVRITDRPDMTLDVYRGRKTTIQQQQQFILEIGPAHDGRGIIVKTIFKGLVSYSVSEFALLKSNVIFQGFIILGKR